MSIAIIFMILALILFVLAAIGIASRINLTAAGLACVTVSLLITGGVLS